MGSYCFYDVVILGGGLNGVLSGIGLSSLGLSVALIEERSSILETVGDRVYALSKRSKDILSSMGVFEKIEKIGPIEDILIYDGKSGSYVHYDHALVCSEPMGHTVYAAELAQVIEKQIKFDTYKSCRYTDISVENGFAVVTLENKQQIHTRLIVCCEGKNSKFRSISNFKTREIDFKQGCIVCNVSHDKNHNNTAIEHFFCSGPFAILPMYGGYTSSIVWTEKDFIAEQMVKLPQDEFRHLLQKKCDDFLGNLNIVSSVNCYKISMVFAEQQYSCRSILIGDSAHHIHPLAGQGLNLGLRDIEKLVEVLGKHNSLGTDIGQDHVLKEIAKNRLFDNFSMALITAGINGIFSSDAPAITCSRRAAMAVVESSDTVKRFLMKQAMGISQLLS